MKSKGIMILGTGSSVGKSLITAAFCRIFARRGISVAPFKSQNMALNSFVTAGGGEMGIAQVLQAAAALTEPHTDMNPVLLKPVSDTGSQVIVNGRVVGNMSVGEYHKYKDTAWASIVESLDRLQQQYDFIVAEGAGSPVEINLSEFDISNIKVAHQGNFPVFLVADIDKGGVFAQIVGTFELMKAVDKKRVAGVIINKFRGDASLLKPGLEFIKQKTGVPVIGVVPYLNNLYLEDEDGTAIEPDKMTNKTVSPVSAIKNRPQIGIIRHPHISNFSDFAPMKGEADIRYIFNKQDLVNAVPPLDCLIIPGTKKTIADLLAMQLSGLADAIIAEYNKGSLFIFGICGGFQCCGNSISDPHCVEGSQKRAGGFGFFDMETVMGAEKITRQVRLNNVGMPGLSTAETLTGYEIHMGISSSKTSKPLFRFDSELLSGHRFEGQISEDGRVIGSYLHGLFMNDTFRQAFYGLVTNGRYNNSLASYHNRRDGSINRIADTVEKQVDMQYVFKYL